MMAMICQSLLQSLALQIEVRHDHVAEGLEP